ncbi:MAG: ATP-binding protein [Nostoc sp. NOS(2021)]|uniref:AAA family ATPase n=1 Tax=Nostoc sp. NOS(2021) TaxID=2815407 RepID=UPI0025FB3A17|nr:AAA family ATPase [Nostoc sp. NOS(2021)]MBN3899093.1 ATP-binding protein [Nostoc sp. NOS(2021)]
MTSPQLPPNAYTNAPQQHPNLILGSLQLLFWFVFRPQAFHNHLKRIDHSLEINFLNINRLRWKNSALYKLFLQTFLILPFLNYFIVSLVLAVLGTPLGNFPLSAFLGLLFVTAFGSVFGAGMGIGQSFGIAFTQGLIFGISFDVGFSVAFGVGFSLNFDIASVLALSLPFGLGLGVTSAYSSYFVELDKKKENQEVSTTMPTNVRRLKSLPLLIIVFSALILFLIIVRLFFINPQFRNAFPTIILGLTINLYLPILLYPFLTVWNALLYYLDKPTIANKRTLSLLRYHSAFWDEWQRIPLIGLDKHLLEVMKHKQVEGRAAMDYLNSSPQRWAAQAVQIELDARSLQDCADVEAIREAHRILIIDELENELSSSFILKIFSRISEDVDAALNQASAYNQRLALRAFADKLNLQLENFARSSDKYTVRFYPIIKSWREIATNYADELAKITELRQEIDSPYIIGVPLTREQEIFTGRDDIGLRIEQLLRDRRRPPLLLYGQRRMGKTSLLNNIGKLLPNNIIPIFVDLQGAPSSASDHAGFLYNLARDMEKSAKKQGLTLPSLTREVLKSDPFTYFDEWLDKVEQALEENTALLALDEFEVLDNAIAKGRFDEQDVLGMLRHLIQHRPRFKVLLAGSHTIEEYQRWASYLINVQVVHISYLKEAEARQLIERPVKDFTLRYESDAVERVLQLTRCHPFLVQLLCAEIIVLKNEQDPSIRRLATLADVEAAIPEALQSGGFFFADIQNNQVDATGQAILRFIAAQGEEGIVSRQTLLQQFPDADITFNLLLQRELIEEVDDGYGFQVELIRRWFI